MQNPDERFVVMALTRKQIAHDLNEYLENVGRDPLPGVKLEPNDDRLNNWVCARYATKLGDLFSREEDLTDDEKEEGLATIQFETLIFLGIDPR